MIKLNYTNMGRKRVHLLHLTTCSPSIWEVRVGTQGRNLEAETEVEAIEGHCLLASSSCFLVAPRTANPEVALPTVIWVYQEMHHTFAHRPSWWKHLLS